MLEIQTTDSACFPRPLSDVIAVAAGPKEPVGAGEGEPIFTSGETHWSIDARVTLRLAAEGEGDSVAWLSDIDAASDFAGVLGRVRSGVRVVILHEDRPLAVVHPVGPLRRTISECIALAKAHEEETGEAPTLDPGFAADVEAILRDREAWDPPSWE
jgi:antitoxin (DNA-binding transcriptional repressor) of toxin-antitoxin stability system